MRRLGSMHTIIHTHFKAGGSGPTALVLAGPVFLRVKLNFNFYKKHIQLYVINKSARMTCYACYNKLYRGARLSAIPRIQFIVMLTTDKTF